MKSLLLILFLVSTGVAAEETFDVQITVDTAKPLGPLRPIWRFFGADEPNYAYMTNGQKLIRELGELDPGNVYFRTHNLLTSGDGTPALKWGSTGVYREDANGAAIYDWTILDRIFDTYLARHVRPYAQIGFMPKDLSVKPEPYQHHWSPRARYEEIYTGWAYPPKDFAKWAELVFQWTKHCVEKYGRAEVERWYWEVWNEPNIGYWRGTPDEFLKLHDYAVDAVRRALPTARVGGPDFAGSGGRSMNRFLEHNLRGTNYATGKVGGPLDFISFHAKGAPGFTNDHVRMGISAALRTIDEGFRIIASYPEAKNKPIVIGECDPDGCAACQGPQLGYRNTTMYSSYTAASFARIHELAEKHGVHIEGALTWAFEFEDQPIFAGFRALASEGVDLPVLNVFRAMSKMSGQHVAIQSDGGLSLEDISRGGVRARPDVSALAAVNDKQINVLVWHYHDDDVQGPAANVRLKIPAPNGKAFKMRVFKIDENHSNAFTVWKEIGSPQKPNADQYKRIESAGKLFEDKSERIEANADGLTKQLTLPRQAVWLLQFEKEN